MNALRWALLVLTLTGCQLPAARPPSPEVSPEPPATPSREGTPLARQPDLRAVLRVPSSAPYDPDALGLGGQFVSLRLTNAGSRPVEIDRLRVAFAAIREGVAFPCKEHVGGSMRDHEPGSLAPGQSFVFERDIDCTMPLPGRYEIRTYVSLTKPRAPGDPGDFAGAFSLDLVGGRSVPQAYPARPGLFLAMTGSRATHPLAAEAWARGDYHVVVAAINGGRTAVAVGSARLAFLTYKKGSPLPCSGQSEPLALPDQLAPGAMHVFQVPVACAPSEEGRYEVVGRMALKDGGPEIEIGRVALKVTIDPLLFAPEPWPSLHDRAIGPGVK